MRWTIGYDYVFAPKDRALVGAAGPEIAVHQLNSRRRVADFLRTAGK